MRLLTLPYCKSAALTLTAVLSFAATSFAQSQIPSNAPSGFPAWWFEWNVIVPTNPTNTSPTWPGDYPTSDDYSAINQGTLKNLALGAITELQAQLPAAVLTNSNAVALQNLISGWVTNPATNADSYAAVNQGQLKYLAKQFYDVLGTGSYTAGLGLQPTNWTSGAYPWSTNSGADPYSLANIGQAKCVFSFDLTAPEGQVPAWWAAYYGVSNLDPSSLSPSGDGNTIYGDYLAHLNPSDLYNGNLPRLTLISGSGQVGPPNGLVAAPLVVSVTDSSNNPINNAPVVFTVGQGGGMVQVSSVGALATSVTARTGSSGQARVFFQLPNTTSTTSQITCSATIGFQSTNVIFSETSGNGTGNYPSPYAPSNVSARLNTDGSVDISWVTAADPSDTSLIPIRYQATDGTWVTNAYAPAGSTSYHLPRQ
jgi:hypothetical protein